MSRHEAHRALALAVLVIVAGAGAGACKIGPSTSVLKGINLELVIQDLRPGAPVHVDVDGTVKDAVAGDHSTLIMFLALGAGRKTGTVTIGTGASALCGAVDVVVPKADAGTPAPIVPIVAFDTRDLPLCSTVSDDAGTVSDDAGTVTDAGTVDAGDADAGEADAGPSLVLGVFLSLQETVTDAVCLTPPLCTTVTTASADGSLVVDDHGAVSTGSIDDADLVALAQQSTAGADALFAGTDATCSVSTGGLVVLHRTVIDGAGTRTDAVDVTTCLTGTAHSLRARLDLLRSLLP